MPSFRARLFALVGALPLAACASTPAPPPVAPAPVAPPVVVESAVAPAPPLAAPEPPRAECVARDGEPGCSADDGYHAWLGRAALSVGGDRDVPQGHAVGPRLRHARAQAWDPGHHKLEGKSKLALDEEVILLHAYRPEGGVVVMGATSAEGWTSVDAVRLDGTCVSLMADEVTTRRPPAPTRSTLAWDRLSESAKGALLATPAVKARADAATKACGAKARRACVKAREQLAGRNRRGGVRARGVDVITERRSETFA